MTSLEGRAAAAWPLLVAEALIFGTTAFCLLIAPRTGARDRVAHAFEFSWRGLALLLFLAPLFVADLLIGISTLAFNARVLDLPGNIYSAIAANAIPGTSFAFLIILSQFVRYDWAMDDAAMVFGAGPFRCFLEITLPIIWPCIFGAFLISFILAFAFVLAGPSMAGSSNSDVPGIGTFSYTGSPIAGATTQAIVVAAN